MLEPITIGLNSVYQIARVQLGYPIKVIATCMFKKQEAKERDLRRLMLQAHTKSLRSRSFKMLWVSLVAIFIIFLLWSVVQIFVAGLLAAASSDAGLLAILLLLGIFVLFPIWITLAVVTLAAYISLSFSAFVGFVILVASYLVERYLKPKIDMATAVSWLDEEMDVLRDHAQKRLHTKYSKDVETKHFMTPILWTTKGFEIPDLLWRIESDQMIFGAYRFVTMAFLEDFLAVYVCNYSFLEQTVVTDHTFEVHYTDIITLWTSHESTSERALSGKKIDYLKTYYLALASDEKFPICRVHPHLPDLLEDSGDSPSGASSSLVLRLDDSDQIEDKTEQVLVTVRELLRDKKRSAALLRPTFPVSSTGTHLPPPITRPGNLL